MLCILLLLLSVAPPDSCYLNNVKYSFIKEIAFFLILKSFTSQIEFYGFLYKYWKTVLDLPWLFYIFFCSYERDIFFPLSEGCLEKYPAINTSIFHLIRRLLSKSPRIFRLVLLVYKNAINFNKFIFKLLKLLKLLIISSSFF